MNVLSLFSGIGGLDLGIRLALPGARVVGYVERDSYCQRVLLARMRDGSLDTAPIWDDVATFRGEPWRGHVHMVCGGFPCQDLSLAGRRAGIQPGNRSGLWYEYLRVIRAVEPRWVFIENVPGLLVRGIDTVLGGLAESGFSAEWGVFSAADVGAPHLRKRVFILGYAAGTRRGWEEPAGETVGRPRPSRRPQPGRSGGSTLADAQRAERGPHALSRGDRGEGLDGAGEAAGRAGERRLAVADAEEQRRELRTAEGEQPGRPASGELALGHASGPGLEERGCQRGNSDEELAATERAGGVHVAQPVREGSSSIVAQEPDEEHPLDSVGASGGGLPLFPPGPADRAGWAALLAERPDLAPATERPVRALDDGLSRRVAQLKACGNAVVPLAAAAALTVLMRRLDP